MTRAGQLIHVDARAVRPSLLAASFLVAACVGVAIAISLPDVATAAIITGMLTVPFLLVALLVRPTYGVLALIFLAPYVDVFRFKTMGVTIRINEVLGLVLMVVAVLHVLKTRQRLRVGPFDLFVFGLLAAMITSLVVNLGNLPSEDRLRNIPTAWIGVGGVLDTPRAATWKKLAQAFVAFAAYFAVSNLITTWRTWRKAVAVFVASGMLVCVWSLLNLAGFLAGVESAFGITVSNIWYSGGAPRIRGTLSEPSYFANLLVLLIPVAFFCYARGTRLIGRWQDALAAALLCITLVFTFSGGGWVVFAVEVAIILGLFVCYRIPMDRLAAMLLAIALAASLALMAAAIFTHMDYGKLADANRKKIVALLQTGVGSGRRIAPDVGWTMFCDHPFLGVGPGRFRTFEYDYLLKMGYRGEPPGSSLYAGVMGELGLTGALMVIGLFVSAVWSSFRWAARASHRLAASILWGMGVAFLAMGVHYLAHDVLWWPYVWVMFGLAAAGTRITRRLTRHGCTDWEADR